MLLLLKEKSVNRFVETTNNSRKPRPFKDAILYFKDTSEYIKPEIPDSIKA